MKLLEQVSLWNREGSADKVYEVDLCEVGVNQYVVNFRYGRRGAALKDGSKTAIPVDMAAARKVFDALVNEKKKGGYQETGRFQANTSRPAPTVQPVVPLTQYADKKAFILAALAQAAKPGYDDKKWPLGRIIWRIGELRIQEAVPDLTRLALKSNDLQQYCICWALGRCGDSVAVPLLEQLSQAPASKDFVQRMALVSLLELADMSKRNSLLHTLFQKLPPTIQQALQSGSSDILRQSLTIGLANQSVPYGVLESLYILSGVGVYPQVRPVILHFIQTWELKPPAFKTIRHIFKIAEFREDSEVWGLLAYRFEHQKAFFRRSRWSDWAYIPNTNGEYTQNVKDELKKPASRLGYSNLTQDYMRRRVLRTLRTFGEDQNSDAYTAFATDLLLQYADTKDRSDSRTSTKTKYTYNRQTRNWDTVTGTTHYDAFANCVSLYYILYEHSNRYELKKNNRAYRCKDGYQAGQPAPASREEAFPELWNKHPQRLMQLLRQSQMHWVHCFATKALKANPDWKKLADKAFAVDILGHEYEETVQLGLELIEQFYHPQNPDIQLVTMLIQHPKSIGRDLAKQWIAAQPDFFAAKTMIFAEVITTPYEDVFEWADVLLEKIKFSDEQAQMLIVKVISELLELKPENTHSMAIAAHAGQQLTSHFAYLLKDINLEIPQELLQHPVSSVQVLGAAILLNHEMPVEQMPQGLMASLIASPEAAVRSVGVTLFGKLPEKQLMESQDILLAFCTSPQPEMRAAIRPTIERLVAQNATFGKQLLHKLLPILQYKEESEGIHEDILQLLGGGLAAYLSDISKDDMWIMLSSRRTTTQRAGFLVVQHTMSPQDLTVRQLVKLANHELLEARTFAWNAFSQQVNRMKQEASEALRILDCKWDDSRQFGTNYFRGQFADADWTPTLLVSVCDSTRPDIQQFGREMITKFFHEENGSDYLLQLSQHPSPSLQTFATYYLEQFATDKPGHLEKLELYFVTVLSQVNRAGMAKTRIFNFLQKEALKNEQAATLIGKIMGRQSATMAVSDKAACIQVMCALRKKYPHIDLPLVLKERELV